MLELFLVTFELCLEMCLDYIDSFPEFEEVQKEIDSYMEVYDAKVAKVSWCFMFMFFFASKGFLDCYMKFDLLSISKKF